MNISLDEAIAIYAQASRKWFRAQAKAKVQQHIHRLAAAGDHEGVDVHERVKRHIALLEESNGSGQAAS